VILLGLSWRLTLIALACAPLLPLIVRPVVAKVRRRWREQADQRGELTSLVSELVGSIKLVRAYVRRPSRRPLPRARRPQPPGRAPGAALLDAHEPLSEVFAGVVILLIFSIGTRLALGQTGQSGPSC